jgi:hypothetical protein
MRVTLMILSCFALCIEVIFWIFLRPFVARTMFGLGGLSLGTGIGVAYGMNPVLTAIPCFLAAFLLMPAAQFENFKIKRADWWRRRFAEFPEPVRRLGYLMLDAPGPF